MDETRTVFVNQFTAPVLRVAPPADNLTGKESSKFSVTNALNILLCLSVRNIQDPWYNDK